MGKKKNKKGKQKKSQKQFWNMDMLKRVLPTVVAASLDRKAKAKRAGYYFRIDAGAKDSRLRKTLRAFRQLVNKNQILLSKRFGLWLATDEHYESDLVLFDFQPKQRMEVYYKKFFSLPMEDKDSITSKTWDINDRIFTEHLKMMKKLMFPNEFDVKTGDVTLWTRVAQNKYTAAKGIDPFGNIKPELDLRHGGYLPMDGPHKDGVATVKKATIDDVPAILTTGEFVLHKEAVRAIGGGSNKRGAVVLYAIMDQLYEMNKQYDYTPDEIDGEDETL